MEYLKRNGYYDLEPNTAIRTGSQLEDYYMNGGRHCGAAYLRFILMAFVCFYNFGFPEPTGIVSTLSGFATPCFYILSGYFVLPDDDYESLEKTGRKIKRSLICFASVFLLYVLINVLISAIHHIPLSVSLRSVFNFAVLNLWPFSAGSNIWFIQAMLYAYILFYIALKLDLMQFYKVLMILSFIIMLMTGEFAGIIHFRIGSYGFIPGNWLTRAIPYILLGKLLREKEDYLLRMAAWKYISLWIIGALMVLAEIYLLGLKGVLVYEGHMIGYGVMAFAACGLAISNPLGRDNPVTSALTYSDPRLSGVIYMLMDPIFYILVLIAGSKYLDIVTRFGGLAALAVSTLIAFLIKNTKPIKAMNS